MVMGDDSCSRGCGFGSDGLFHIDFVAKIVLFLFCLKRPKINEKEAGHGPLKSNDIGIGSLKMYSNIRSMLNERNNLLAIW